MSGPFASPPPLPPLPPRRPSGAAAVVVRLLFAAVPVCTLGLLAWVPSLRFAVVRGRRWDWAVFAAVVALTVGYVALVLTASQEEESPLDTVAVLYMLVFMVGTTVHAVVADLLPAGAVRPQHSPQRIHQVAVELEALERTLRGTAQGGPAPGTTRLRKGEWQ